MTSVILLSSMSRRLLMSPALFSSKKRRAICSCGPRAARIWKLIKMIWPLLIGHFLTGKLPVPELKLCRVFPTALCPLNPRRRFLVLWASCMRLRIFSLNSAAFWEQYPICHPWWRPAGLRFDQICRYSRHFIDDLIPILNQSTIFVGSVVGFLDVCTIRLVASSLPPRYHF